MCIRDSHHAVAVLGDLDARKFAKQLRELIGAIAAHVEIRVAFEKTAADLSKARGFAVVLIVRDDIGHGALDLLDARPASLPCGRSGLASVPTTGCFAAIAYKQLKRSEDIACLAKRHRSLLLTHTDDGQSAFALSLIHISDG